MNSNIKSAIVLAAGSSIRMGSVNKLLLSYNNSNILEAVILQLQNSCIDEIIVVLGHEKAVIKTLLSPYKGLLFCHNWQYKSGMTSSIQTGLKSASEKSNGYLICLSDMPFLDVNDYNTILNRTSGKKEILVPFHNTKKGNPIYFSRHFKSEILKHTEVEGCKKIVQKNSHFVKRIIFANNHILRDIDTIKDYSIAKNKT